MPIEDYFTEVTHRDWETESVEGTVNIAIIGVGGFARNRAIPAISKSEYGRTTVLVTSSPETLAETEAAADVDHCIDYDAFLQGECRDAYDAVYISTPNALHGTYAAAAASMGAHVICEKPLETTPDRAREIIDACAAADVTLMTAYRLQLEPIVRRTRTLLNEGVLGEIVAVHGSFSNPLLEEADPDTWRLDPDLAGGGVLVDLGIYPINTIRFLLECEPTGVYAHTRTESGDSPFGDVDRDVSLHLRLPGGGSALCTASYVGHAGSQLRLVGTDGSVTISSPFGGVVPHDILLETGDLSMEYTGEPIDEVREEFDYFCYCILTGTTPEPDGEDGVADLEIIEAAYESARDVCVVPLGED